MISGEQVIVNSTWGPRQLKKLSDTFAFDQIPAGYDRSGSPPRAIYLADPETYPTRPQEPGSTNQPTLNTALGAGLVLLSEQLTIIGDGVGDVLALVQRDGTGQTNLSVGIGHNNPPTVELLSESELVDVLESVGEVQGELTKADPAFEADITILRRAENRINRFKQLIQESPMLLARGGLTAAGGLILTYLVGHFAELSIAIVSVLSTIALWIRHARH